MAVKKKFYGAIVKHHMSWNIRQMLDDRNHKHDGTFGIYAGRKKLLKDGFSTVDEACDHIDKKLMTTV